MQYFFKMITPEDCPGLLKDGRSLNLAQFEQDLRKYGALLFRGFQYLDVQNFSELIAKFFCVTSDYNNRSTPRKKLTDKVFTSTEYPNELTIPLHCECSYSKQYPEIISFLAVTPAEFGGETPIVDMHRVYESLPERIVTAFETKGLCYVRNYYQGVDLSWQEVFQTENKEDVIAYCEQHKIQYTWNKNNVLTTKQYVPATIIHPEHLVSIWFNQANLFHISALSQEYAELMISIYGEKNLPRNVYYGNGDIINSEDIATINQICEAQKYVFKWHQNDMLILDNLRVAHGRHSFSGKRSVVVCMGNKMKTQIN